MQNFLHFSVASAPTLHLNFHDVWPCPGCPCDGKLHCVQAADQDDQEKWTGFSYTEKKGWEEGEDEGGLEVVVTARERQRSLELGSDLSSSSKEVDWI